MSLFSKRPSHQHDAPCSHSDVREDTVYLRRITVGIIYRHGQLEECPFVCDSQHKDKCTWKPIPPSALQYCFLCPFTLYWFIQKGKVNILCHQCQSTGCISTAAFTVFKPLKEKQRWHAPTKDRYERQLRINICPSALTWSMTKNTFHPVTWIRLKGVSGFYL